MRDLEGFFKGVSADWPWPRFASVLALVLLLAGIKFVEDWPSLCRLLAGGVGVVLIALIAELLYRRVLMRRRRTRRVSVLSSIDRMRPGIDESAIHTHDPE